MIAAGASAPGGLLAPSQSPHQRTSRSGSPEFACADSAAQFLALGGLPRLLVGEDPQATGLGERVDLSIEQLPLGRDAGVSDQRARRDGGFGYERVVGARFHTLDRMENGGAGVVEQSDFLTPIPGRFERWIRCAPPPGDLVRQSVVFRTPKDSTPEGRGTVRCRGRSGSCRRAGPTGRGKRSMTGNDWCTGLVGDASMSRQPVRSAASFSMSIRRRETAPKKLLVGYLSVGSPFVNGTSGCCVGSFPPRAVTPSFETSCPSGDFPSKQQWPSPDTTRAPVGSSDTGAPDRHGPTQGQSGGAPWSTPRLPTSASVVGRRTRHAIAGDSVAPHAVLSWMGTASVTDRIGTRRGTCSPRPVPTAAKEPKRG